MKPTLVIGASTNPARYSFMAVTQLRQHGHPVIAYGLDKGSVAGVTIENEWNESWQVDTVTLYLNPVRQEAYYDKIIALRPKRVIFNPGTENPLFASLLETSGIETEVACTLVLLSINRY